MNKKSFLQGAVILGAAGIFVKILGALYRIPLLNIIGDEGIGYYQTSYPIYSLLFAISTAGLPVAIAKLVSEKRAVGQYKNAHKIFKISFLGLVIGGVLTSLVILFGSKYIVNYYGWQEAYYSMIALAPALLLVPIMAAIRGYFQGRQNMVPTACSQIVEQLLRVGVGLFLAKYLLDSGLDKAAGGAAFGASAGAIGATILIMIIYAYKRKSIGIEVRSDKTEMTDSTSNIIRSILVIAIPITIGAAIVPLMNNIDVAIIGRKLQIIGYTKKEATKLFGQMTGMAQTLVNFPQMFSIALVMSLVPAISSVYATSDYRNVRKLSISGIRVSLIVGLPSALGLYALATPIIKLLYYTRPLETQESAGAMLSVLAFSVIFLALVQAMTGILQAVGKPFIPVRNLIIGAIFKVIISYILTGIKSIGIYGAIIGTIVAYAVASILNYISVKKYVNIRPNFIEVVVKPAISAILMLVVVKISYIGISNVISAKIATILSIIVGGVVYAIALFITGAITERDFQIVPKGDEIVKILKRVGMFR
ncbi:polysaccharide biosynthesis protein [Clostridiaceae bacterium M8S5]|nr:polysaccharide biosynthesis protein [Clostridiaceae bacterium M8S5]